jgi:hypothetical protein
MDGDLFCRQNRVDEVPSPEKSKGNLSASAAFMNVTGPTSSRGRAQLQYYRPVRGTFWLVSPLMLWTSRAVIVLAGIAAVAAMECGHQWYRASLAYEISISVAKIPIQLDPMSYTISQDIKNARARRQDELQRSSSDYLFWRIATLSATLTAVLGALCWCCWQWMEHRWHRRQAALHLGSARFTTAHLLPPSSLARRRGGRDASRSAASSVRVNGPKPDCDQAAVRGQEQNDV